MRVTKRPPDGAPAEGAIQAQVKRKRPVGPPRPRSGPAVMSMYALASPDAGADSVELVPPEPISRAKKKRSDASKVSAHKPRKRERVPHAPADGTAPRLKKTQKKKNVTDKVEPPKMKKQPPKAEALLRVISAKDKTKHRIEQKAMTVEVSLIGRTLPGVREALDTMCRDFSEVAQIASRLANFVVEGILGGTTSQEEQLTRLAGLYEPNKASWGCAFINECMSMIATNGSNPKKIEVDEFDTFVTTFGDIPRPRWQQHKDRIQEEMRSTIRKDTAKLLDDRMSKKGSKIAGWIRHRLRAGCWDDMYRYCEQLNCLERADGQNPRLYPKARTKEMIYKLGDTMAKAVWLDEPTIDWEENAPTLRIAQTMTETFSKLRGWLELYRPVGLTIRENARIKREVSGKEPVASEDLVPVLLAGRKSSPHVTLWILHQISREFAAASEPRRFVYEDIRGDSKEAKKARKQAIDKLPIWQQEAPSAFGLLPIKRAHTVNFLNVTASVAINLLRQLERKPEFDGPFWWKDLLQLDDDDWVGAGSKDEFETARGARRDGIQAARFRQCKTRDQKTLSRISGLATSQTHLDNMLRRAEWHRDNGQSPCHPLILTGFRTNGRELHLILAKHTRKPGAPPGGPVARVRTHGFDLLGKRGYGAIGTEAADADDGEERVELDPHAKSLDIDNCKNGGIYAVSKKIERSVKVVVVDPGQINPIAFVHTTISPSTIEFGRAQVVTSSEFHIGRGTRDAVQQGPLSPDAQQRLELKAEMKRANDAYAAEVRNAPKDSQPTRPIEPDGLTLLRSKTLHRIGIEGKRWADRELLLNGPRDSIRMLRRDLLFKRKRMRCQWTRDWALALKQLGVELIAFGNGQCNARGHRKMPTKQVIRHLATILAVLILDEFGTSSRCPDCKSTTKLVHPERDVTTQQVSYGEHSTEFDDSDDKEDDALDSRTETCTQCSRVWGHDEVSVYNLGFVTQSILNGTARPSWLDRKNCKAN
jgi:hypothetical protein